MIICFIIYIAANTGLALQTSFPALLVLRMVQSSGASGTGAISSGVVSDVATRAERGSYVGLAALGQTLGPTLGPLIGGLLIHFKGWRSTFWFLDIYAGVMILVFLLLIPETCRNIVGNGSVPPQKWNFSLIAYLQQHKRRKRNVLVASETVSNKRRTGLLASLPIIASRESFLLLIYGGIMYAGYYIILTGLPQQLESTFNYNSIQVGLCYIPMGFGAIVARQVTGRLVDWNFRRHGKRLGIVILKSQQTNIDNFPVERARLEIAFPLAYLSCVVIVPYGWIMNMHDPPLPAALVLLFFTTFSLSGSFQCLQVLMIDCYPDSPSSASAANNLIRCILGAGAVALVEPLLRTFGRGWTGTFIVATEACFSLCWWAVYIWGPGWRKERKEKRAKLDEKEAQKNEEKVAKDANSEALLVSERDPKNAV
jgi:predicted MFS family arabinose efflux permease